MPAFVLGASAVEEYRAGLAGYQAGHWSEAISHLEAAVKEDPSLWEAYNLLAYAYHQAKDPAKALESCEMSLKLHPDNPRLREFRDRIKAAMPPPSPTPQATRVVVEEPSPTVVVQSSDKPNVPAHEFFLVGGSVDTPLQPAGFVADWTTGIGWEFGYGTRLNDLVFLTFNGRYSSFPLHYSFPGLTYSGGGIQVLAVLVGARFEFTAPGSPLGLHLNVGAGPSEFIGDAVTATDPLTGLPVATGVPAITETDAALQAGLGIELQVANDLSVYLEDSVIETFVSAQVASQGTMMTNHASLGLKLDN